MRLSGSGAISFLVCISLVVGSLLNYNVVDDGATLLRGSYCVTPQVRREWRSLSDGEKAEWIGAVKVGPSDAIRRDFAKLRPTRTVLGNSPSQRICGTLPESCELHLESAVGKEHFYVRW